MANFYCDISAIGAANEYQAYAATPTLDALATDRPRPMDGNGKAQNAVAAAVAIAELQITTLPTDGQTLSIGGSAAITAKTTVAAKNQFAIGASIATATTNLTALINTFGTTSNTCDVAAVAAVSQALLAIPYLYYARVKPGTTDTIQLFTRIAGAAFNTATNSTSKITQTGTWLNSGAASINFTEGVDGPFGYFINQATTFGKAQSAYGVFVAKSSGPTETGANDCIYVRTKRSGANLTCALTSSTGSITSRVPANAFRNFLFDNGTTWSGDNGQMTVSMINTNASGSNFLQCATDAQLRLEAIEKYGFRFYTQTVAAGKSYLGTQGGALLCNKILVEAGNANSVIYFGAGASNYERFKFIDSKAYLLNNQILCAAWGANIGNYWACINSIIEYAGVGGNVTSLFSCGGDFFTSSGAGEILIDGTTFIVDGGAFLVGSFMTGGSNVTAFSLGRFRVANCPGLHNPSVGFAASLSRYLGPTFTWTDSKTGSFRLERCFTTTEYVSSNSYPTLGVTNIAGDPMSYRVSWEASRLESYTQHEVGRFTLNYRDTSAVKTIDIELLAPSVEIPKKCHLALFVTYTDSAGSVQNESSIEAYSVLLAGGGTQLPAGVGAASWAGDTTGMTSVKCTLTTTQAVKQNSEITARLMIVGPPTGTRSLYVSPEIRVS